MMVKVAKMRDGRIVEIVRTAETVGFSPEPGWVLVCFDFDKVDRKRSEFKWVPALAVATQFEWVREYTFG
jgi:hypothetical protein